MLRILKKLLHDDFMTILNLPTWMSVKNKWKSWYSFLLTDSKEKFLKISNEPEIHPLKLGFLGKEIRYSLHFHSFLFEQTKKLPYRRNAEISSISGLATRNLFFTCVCLSSFFSLFLVKQFHRFCFDFYIKKSSERSL